MKVNNRTVEAIIDSGAATSIITDRLRRKLNLTIQKPSEAVFTMANGNSTPSLGEIEINIEMNDTEIPTKLQVIDSEKEDLIIGNELFEKKEGNIDFATKKLTVKHQGKTISVPIYYSKSVTKEEDKIEETIKRPSQYLAELYSIQPIKQDEIKAKPKIFRDFIKIGEEDKETKEKIYQLIEEYKDICATDNTKIGRTNLIKHEIELLNNKPFKINPYTTNPEQKKIIKNEIDKMLKDGVIRESKSPYASPVVIVTKKSGNPRFCINFKKLNERTRIDAYPLPRIDGLLELFRETKIFTSIDLAYGFWQVEMKEEDKHKTAFSSDFGLYEFNVMPFGLVNAPPTFQRLLNKVLDGYLYDFAVVYVDDILIFSKTVEEHFIHLKKILDRLKNANLTVKLKKCKFFEPNIEFLGHQVGRDGLKPNERNIEKIKNLKPPTNVSETRMVMGLANYYRYFIRNYSTIAKPINQLLKKETEFIWGEKQQKAFETIKERLTNSPVLAHPNFDKEFHLFTDASGVGIGAVLSQINENNKEVVISYWSKTLKDAEQRYPNTDRECLAVVLAVNHFHKYLIPKEFHIYTDHSALRTMMDETQMKGRRGNWTSKLQIYKFTINHRPGERMKHADALSRLNIDKNINT